MSFFYYFTQNTALQSIVIDKFGPKEKNCKSDPVVVKVLQQYCPSLPIDILRNITLKMFKGK